MEVKTIHLPKVEKNITYADSKMDFSPFVKFFLQQMEENLEKSNETMRL
jgi:hypothetical protein